MNSDEVKGKFYDKETYTVLSFCHCDKLIILKITLNLVMLINNNSKIAIDQSML